jgi:NTE family protein
MCSTPSPCAMPIACPKASGCLCSGAEATKRSGSGVLSYLLFEAAYCQDLMQLGYADGCERKEEMKKFFNLDEYCARKTR